MDHNKKTEVLDKAPAVSVHAQPVSDEPSDYAVAIELAHRWKARAEKAEAALAATQLAAPAAPIADGHAEYWKQRALAAEAWINADDATVPAQGEREAFEAWWFKRIPESETSMHAREFAFEVWRAALAAKVQPVAVPSREAIEKALWDCFEYGKRDYKGCVRETLSELFAAAPAQASQAAPDPCDSCTGRCANCPYDESPQQADGAGGA